MAESDERPGILLWLVDLALLDLFPRGQRRWTMCADDVAHRCAAETYNIRGGSRCVDSRGVVARTWQGTVRLLFILVAERHRGKVACRTEESSRLERVRLSRPSERPKRSILPSAPSRHVTSLPSLSDR